LALLILQDPERQCELPPPAFTYIDDRPTLVLWLDHIGTTAAKDR